VFIRATETLCIFYFMMSVSSPNPMFDHLLESSDRDDSNKRSNKGFAEEIMQAVPIEVYLSILSTVSSTTFMPTNVYKLLETECLSRPNSIS